MKHFNFLKMVSFLPLFLVVLTLALGCTRGDDTATEEAGDMMEETTTADDVMEEEVVEIETAPIEEPVADMEEAPAETEANTETEEPAAEAGDGDAGKTE